MGYDRLLIDYLFKDVYKVADIRTATKRYHLQIYEKQLTNAMTASIFMFDKDPDSFNKYLTDKVINDKFSGKIFMQAVYYSRSLAFGYIREGFVKGFNFTPMFHTLDPLMMYKEIQSCLIHAIDFEGSDLVEIEFEEGGADREAVGFIRSAIRTLGREDAKRLVEAWTGSSMLPTGLNIHYETEGERIITFAACSSTMMVTGRALYGPSCTEVEDNLTRGAIMTERIEERFIKSVQWAIRQTCGRFDVA